MVATRSDNHSEVGYKNCDSWFCVKHTGVGALEQTALALWLGYPHPLTVTVPGSRQHPCLR